MIQHLGFSYLNKWMLYQTVDNDHILSTISNGTGGESVWRETGNSDLYTVAVFPIGWGLTIYIKDT